MEIFAKWQKGEIQIWKGTRFMQAHLQTEKNVKIQKVYECLAEYIFVHCNIDIPHYKWEQAFRELKCGEIVVFPDYVLEEFRGMRSIDGLRPKSGQSVTDGGPNTQ